MTTEEAAEILRMFSAAYPQVKISELTTRIWWESALQATDFVLGKRIALDLIAHQSPQFPTPAVFNGIKTQLTNRETNRIPTTPTDTGWQPSPEAKRKFDDMRSAIGMPRKHTPEPKPEPKEVQETEPAS